MRIVPLISNNLLKMTGTILSIFIASVIGCSSVHHSEQIELMPSQVTLSSTPIIPDTPKIVILPVAALPPVIKPDDYKNLDSVRKQLYNQTEINFFLLHRAVDIRDRLDTMQLKLSRLQDTLDAGVGRSRNFYIESHKNRILEQQVKSYNNSIDRAFWIPFILQILIIAAFFILQSIYLKKNKHLPYQL